MSHTPGPWYIAGAQVYSRAHEINYSGNPAEAPYIWRVVPTIHGKTEDEIDANGRLIAAAPDLLEAAKHVLAILMHPTQSVSILDAEKLEAAIAKAEGK